VRLSQDVSLLPPVSIGGGCGIEAGATIGGRTSLGEGCFVGEGAMVEGSILFGGARVGEATIVRNSVVGPSVLGAGCVVEEDNVLDCGARVNSGTRLPRGAMTF
jgi:mannose-1-phosphate guanylyltransferase